MTKQAGCPLGSQSLHIVCWGTTINSLHQIPNFKCFLPRLVVVFAQMKSGIKSRMKMQLEQRRQALLQLHLSDQQFYCLVGCALL